MQVLSPKHPDVYKHFSDVHLSYTNKTNRAFSSIAFDHAHKQVNALLKGQGGAVGLTENPAALRWMVAGPELSWMVEEFEGSFTVSKERDHHEQKPGVQST